MRKLRMQSIYTPLYNIFILRYTKTNTKIFELIKKEVMDKSVLIISSGSTLTAERIEAYAASVCTSGNIRGLIRVSEKMSDDDRKLLDYPDNSFDVVIAVNAMRAVADSRKMTGEIKRVMKEDGILIAPSFIHDYRYRPRRTAFLSGLCRLLGRRGKSLWDMEEYMHFLESAGFSVIYYAVFRAGIPLMYAKCCMD